jgi:prepilin-type N-terminal cleavage/methylation domain-containing protein
MRTNEGTGTPAADDEAGFTLVEVLIAIVVLVFGLIAVTNLLLVAASNNTAANLGTASAAAASQQMDVLKATRFNNLVAGTTTQVVMMPGTGPIQVTTTVEVGGTPNYRQITVVANGIGPLVAARSRIVLTAIRSCVSGSFICG